MSAIASAFKTMACAAKPALAGRQFTRAAPSLRAPAFKARGLSIASPAFAKYGSEKKGEYPSLEFRIFFNEDGKPVSPWHGVPLHNPDGTCNFICEIPKETKAKMEVATDEEMTPIKQDTKKGKLRDYPYNINWNYGMLPRTWEDPGHEHPTMKVKGDNDPVDVVEIGSVALAMGSVTPVKPVGVYAMIDDGELDWKGKELSQSPRSADCLLPCMEYSIPFPIPHIHYEGLTLSAFIVSVIAIAASDPKAKDINDVADVEKHFPGELEKIRVWFRDYKTPDGKPINEFGLDDKCMDKKYTMAVIEETAGFYDKLVSGERENDGGLSLK